MLVTQTHPDPYFGKNILGRVLSGEATVGLPIQVHDQDGKLIESGKITRIMKKNGLSHIELDKAFAGDIVSIAGVPKSKVTHTATEEGNP